MYFPANTAGLSCASGSHDETKTMQYSGNIELIIEEEGVT